MEIVKINNDYYKEVEHKENYRKETLYKTDGEIISIRRFRKDIGYYADETTPSYEEFNKGKISSQHYYLIDSETKQSIGDNPAQINYHDNGNVFEIFYYKDNCLHRENDAAYIMYNKKGKIVNEFYYRKGDALKVSEIKSIKKRNKRKLILKNIKDEKNTKII